MFASWQLFLFVLATHRLADAAVPCTNHSVCAMKNYCLAVSGSSFCVPLGSGQERCEKNTTFPDTNMDCLDDELPFTGYRNCGPGRSRNVLTALTSYCEDCPAAYWESSSRATSCNNCNSGTWQDASAQTTCKSCQHGAYSTVAMNYCEDCAAGTFSPSSASSVCTACTDGHYLSLIHI